MRSLNCFDAPLAAGPSIRTRSKVGRGILLLALLTGPLLLMPSPSIATPEARDTTSVRGIDVEVWAPGRVADPFDNLSEWALVIYKRTDGGAWDAIDSWLLGPFMTSPDGARRLSVRTATDYAEGAMRPLTNGTYRLKIVDGRGIYPPIFYPASSSLESASDVVVSDTDPVPAVSISFPSHVGSFYGRVSTWSGGLAPWLKIYKRDADGRWRLLLAHGQGEGTTTPDGPFRYGALVPGSYRVGYENGDGCQQLRDTYWPSSPTLKGARNIEISPGAVVRGIDVAIPRQRPEVSLKGRARVGRTLVASIQSLGAVSTRWYVGKQLVRMPARATSLRLRPWMKGERVTVKAKGWTCTDTERFRTTVTDRSQTVR
jgi:hypothetical protein